MDTTANYRFDPVDLEQMRLLGQLAPEKRVQVMLATQELAVGLIRGRLSRRYPDLSPRKINLKVLEEIERVDERPPDLDLFLDILHTLETVRG